MILLRICNSTHLRKCNNHDIGIVTINTAWTSSSDNDKNNLFFPDSLIKDALEKIKSAKCKVLLMHHPLYWLKDFNHKNVLNLVLNNFDMIFSGHVHDDQISTHFTSKGVFEHISPAVLTYDNDDKIGYSIVEIDVNENYSLSILNSTYNKSNTTFIDEDKVFVNLPSDEAKTEIHKFRSKILDRYEHDFALANDLVLYQNEGQSFLDLFTPPALNARSSIYAAFDDRISNTRFEELYDIKNNFIILGKDKCGKTSLLKKIQLHYLANFSFDEVIPLYLDYKEIQLKGFHKIDIIRLIADHYGLNYKIIQKFLLRIFISSFNR